MTKSIKLALTATIKAEKNRRAAEILIGQLHKYAELSKGKFVEVSADELVHILGYMKAVDGNLTAAEYHLHAVNSQS